MPAPYNSALAGGAVQMGARAPISIFMKCTVPRRFHEHFCLGTSCMSISTAARFTSGRRPSGAGVRLWCPVRLWA